MTKAENSTDQLDHPSGPPQPTDAVIPKPETSPNPAQPPPDVGTVPVELSSQPRDRRSSSVSGRRDSYRSSRRSSKAALESLLNLKVNTPAEKFQLLVGREIRFSRDSELSEEDMLALQRGRRVRFLMPRAEAVHTYEQVQLEGQEAPDPDAQSDVDLIAAVDGNIEDIRTISSRLEVAIKVREQYFGNRIKNNLQSFFILFYLN